jgi:thymidylate kinase
MESHDRQREHDPGSRPFLVSFSGIDGAGKTTQIEKLAAWLRNAGMCVTLVTYWDDVAALRRLREGLGHALFKGDEGVGTPAKPVRRRDKNVQSWYLLPARVSLCFLDALSLAFELARLKRKHDADVVIFDRYIYDQFANLDVSNRLVRACVRLLLHLVMQPNVAYLLDVDPVLARARKPEYPLEFLYSNRNSYLEVGKLTGMDVIPPGTLDEVEGNIRRELPRRLGEVLDSIQPDLLTSR